MMPRKASVILAPAVVTVRLVHRGAGGDRKKTASGADVLTVEGIPNVEGIPIIDVVPVRLDRQQGSSKEPAAYS